MAKITVQVTGGSLQQKEASNVTDLLAQLSLTNYTANVNGDAVANDYEFEDYEFVILAPSVKGAAKKATTKTVTKKGGSTKGCK